MEDLREVLADLESGKLGGGGWREQYVASAIGLLGSGCYAEAATHVAQVRTTASVNMRPSERRGSSARSGKPLLKG